MTCWLCGFETTELATNAKVPVCRNRPCQACVAVAELDEEINQTVATLQRLLVKRCDLRAEQNRVHCSLIHRLPVELKNHIVELLLPSWDELGDPQRVKTPVLPTFLASVCRGWRDVAWSDPLLWSTIHIRLGTKVPTSDPCSYIDILHQWILRSRTLPLHIIFYDTECPDEGLKCVIDTISQFSHRWHSLSIGTRALPALQQRNLQCRLLKRLRIPRSRGHERSSVSILNSEVSPEEIELCGVSFQSLRISWNHLSSAKVRYFTFHEIMQLFQHALQMTDCQIFLPQPPWNSSIPPITHRRLKTLSLCFGLRPTAATLLSHLTLPSLQGFHTNDLASFTTPCLPALMQRSSCPLTRISLSLNRNLRDNTSQPLHGVTELVLEHLIMDVVLIKKLLFEDFPDLCCLTLRPQVFLDLWKLGIISLLLGRKKPRPDAANGGGYFKIVVLGRGRVDELSDFVWESEIGRELKTLEVDMRSTADGFEFLVS